MRPRRLKPVLDPRWQWYRLKGRFANNPYWYEDYFTSICKHPLEARFLDLMSGFGFCCDCGCVIDIIEQSSAKVPDIINTITAEYLYGG